MLTQNQNSFEKETPDQSVTPENSGSMHEGLTESLPTNRLETTNSLEISKNIEPDFQSKSEQTIPVVESAAEETVSNKQIQSENPLPEKKVPQKIIDPYLFTSHMPYFFDQQEQARKYRDDEAKKIEGVEIKGSINNDISD